MDVFDRYAELYDQTKQEEMSLCLQRRFLPIFWRLLPGFQTASPPLHPFWLGKPQLCQRSNRISPTYIRSDAQLQHSNHREIDVIVFRLLACPLRAEVPLLPHDLPEGLTAVRRPAQGELLGARRSAPNKTQPDPPKSLGLGEKKPKSLFPARSRLPSRA